MKTLYFEKTIIAVQVARTLLCFPITSFKLASYLYGFSSVYIVYLHIAYKAKVMYFVITFAIKCLVYTKFQFLATFCHHLPKVKQSAFTNASIYSLSVMMSDDL